MKRFIKDIFSEAFESSLYFINAQKSLSYSTTQPSEIPDQFNFVIHFPIEGYLKGHFYLLTSEEAAKEIFFNLTGTQSNDINEEFIDAIAELGNMVFGQAKNKSMQTPDEFKMQTPKIIRSVDLNKLNFYEDNFWINCQIESYDCWAAITLDPNYSLTQVKKLKAYLNELSKTSEQLNLKMTPKEIDHYSQSFFSFGIPMDTSFEFKSILGSLKRLGHEFLPLLGSRYTAPVSECHLLLSNIKALCQSFIKSTEKYLISNDINILNDLEKNFSNNFKEMETLRKEFTVIDMRVLIIDDSDKFGRQIKKLYNRIMSGVEVIYAIDTKSLLNFFEKDPWCHAIVLNQRFISDHQNSFNEVIEQHAKDIPKIHLGNDIIDHSDTTKQNYQLSLPIEPAQFLSVLRNIIEASQLMPKAKFDKTINFKKVLIAEDNPINLKLLNKLLKNWNLDLTCVNDGEEAIEAFQYDPTYDLVLTDIDMPKMNGIDLAKRIKNLQRNSTLVCITGLEKDNDLFKSLPTDLFDLVLRKPINRNDLIAIALLK